MSAPSYFTLGIVTIMVIVTYAVNPDPNFLRMALPMLLVLIGIPFLMNWMNRLQADKVDMRNYKLYKIKDLSKLESGAPVRLCGIVESSSLKWLNRPHFLINDGSGEVGIIMFTAPREDIRPGDKIETAGTLRAFGLAKQKKVWGLRMNKI